MQTKILALLVFIGAFLSTNAQDSVYSLPKNYLETVASKANKIEAQLTKKTNVLLTRMQKQEQKLKKKLDKIDSLASAKLFSASEKKYAELQAKLNAAEKITSQTGLGYIPYMDTLTTTLKFLNNNIDKIKNSSKLSDALTKVNSLETKLDQANAIKQLLKERRQYLKEQLSKFGLAKHMKKINKKVYYYSQAIQEYKTTLKDHKKIEEKAITILRNVPAFKKFMQSNSQLAGIFGAPSGNPGQVSFAGLQTRGAVQQLIQNSIGPSANPQQFISQQLQNANNQVGASRNSIRLPELQDNMGEMPNFKPNQQKSKSFLKRLEYGGNIQFGKVNRFLPVTSEIAASIGYKLNDNGVIGVGSSYKLGLGTGINHIRFSHQGFGLRSYIDWKLKGSIYIAGGYEKNYLPQLTDISQTLEAWQESGLVGISKKYPAGKKRKGYVQVLFDFLSYKNIPRSQPVLFRTGINF